MPSSWLLNQIIEVHEAGLYIYHSHFIKPRFHQIVIHRRSLSYGIGDDRRCSMTMIGDELRFNENQAKQLPRSLPSHISCAQGDSLPCYFQGNFRSFVCFELLVERISFVCDRYANRFELWCLSTVNLSLADSCGILERSQGLADAPLQRYGFVLLIKRLIKTTFQLCARKPSIRYGSGRNSTQTDSLYTQCRIS